MNFATFKERKDSNEKVLVFLRSLRKRKKRKRKGEKEKKRTKKEKRGEIEKTVYTSCVTSINNNNEMNGIVFWHFNELSYM